MESHKNDPVVVVPMDAITVTLCADVAPPSPVRRGWYWVSDHEIVCHPQALEALRDLLAVRHGPVEYRQL